jgi:hypothetical protein
MSCLLHSHGKVAGIELGSLVGQAAFEIDVHAPAGVALAPADA